MEKNEKIQLLLDMQEHPENYSEQALETMLEDPEVRELMEATELLKQAMIWENARKSTVNVMPSGSGLPDSISLTASPVADG